MKTFLRHASSFLAPIVMGLVLPYFIIRSEQNNSGRVTFTTSPAAFILGLILFAAGLGLFIAAVRMFILIGKGTIMPWDPTRKLIVASLYRYVRNPMILSLIILISGEALLFGSWGTALLAAAFFAINTVYFITSEEPGLEKRFGQEYVEYKKNVPRWIPRLTPWQPNKK